MTLPTHCVLALALTATACNAAGGDEHSTRDLAPASGDPAGPPQDSGPASSAAGYTQTKYPIVLAHGLLGFRKLAGVIDYFFGIPSDLRSSGAQVFVTQVSAINSSEVRGEQLLAQIEQIVAQTGAGKVNLIGHSQGGVDARYVMGVRPDLIASLTAVASPHLGSEAGDKLLEYVTGDSFGAAVIVLFGDAFGAIEDLLTGTTEPQDVIGVLRIASATASAAFNKKYPAGLPTTACGQGAPSNGNIPLFSWTGSTVKTNRLDVSDAILGLTASLSPDEGDGLVGRCISHFGTVLRDDYVMNHLDEINQLFGLTAATEVDPRELYRAHANRLKLAGL